MNAEVITHHRIGQYKSFTVVLCQTWVLTQRTDFEKEVYLPDDTFTRNGKTEYPNAIEVQDPIGLIGRFVFLHQNEGVDYRGFRKEVCFSKSLNGRVFILRIILQG